MLSLLVTVGVGWSSLISLHHITMSMDKCIRLETCIHCWWSRRHFLLLADGFSCRLFCDDMLVDQSLLETALSPCYGHSLVSVCPSLSLSASPSSVYTGGLTEKSLGQVLPSYHFWLSSYFTQWRCVLLGLSYVLAWSLLSLRRLLACLLLLHVEFQRLLGGGLRLLLRDFDHLDLFH